MPNEEIVLDVNVLAKDQEYCETLVRSSIRRRTSWVGVFDHLKGGETCQMYARFDQW
jgi:hypothetical protein